MLFGRDISVPYHTLYFHTFSLHNKMAVPEFSLCLIICPLICFLQRSGSPAANEIKDRHLGHRHDVISPLFFPLSSLSLCYYPQVLFTPNHLLTLSDSVALSGFLNLPIILFYLPFSGLHSLLLLLYS